MRFIYRRLESALHLFVYGSSRLPHTYWWQERGAGRQVYWPRALHWALSHNTHFLPLEDSVTLYSLSPDFQKESCQNAFLAEWVLTNGSAAGTLDESSFGEEERDVLPLGRPLDGTQTSHLEAGWSWRQPSVNSQWDDDNWRFQPVVLTASRAFVNGVLLAEVQWLAAEQRPLRSSALVNQWHCSRQTQAISLAVITTSR